MSYNQTYGKINKSEEVEKRNPRGYSTKKVQKQIVDAMKMLRDNARKMNDATNAIHKAANMIEGAGNLIDILKIYEDGKGKADKKRRTDIRTSANMLRSVYRDIESMILSKVPDFRVEDFHIEVAHVLAVLDGLDKR